MAPGAPSAVAADPENPPHAKGEANFPEGRTSPCVVDTRQGRVTSVRETPNTVKELLP